MHMADALVSPVVGGTMLAATGGLIVYSARKLRQEGDDAKVPLMGVLGAFVFAAQMINFTIPVTGSSGHLGGGMILAVLLGSSAAFLAMASVLTVQALFFGDGGLLALGCNIFNLGFFPCFLVYPLVFRKIAGGAPTQGRLMAGAMISAVLSLQAGAFGVVLETVFSGVSELPFATFAALMQPIHLAIGIVEGLVTASVVSFVWKARPELVGAVPAPHARHPRSIRKVVLAFLGIALFTGAFLSWFASSNPDGLEWAMARTSGKEELESPGRGVHERLAGIQKITAFFPGYDFRKPEEKGASRTEPGKAGGVSGERKQGAAWPAPAAGTSLAGVIGSIITLGIALMIGFGLRRLHRKT